MKVFFSGLCCLVICFCSAQPYPTPLRIDPNQKAALEMRIKMAKQDPDEARALFGLCGLYYHGPFKIKSDLEKSILLAEKAQALAIRLNDRKAVYDARFIIAEALIAERNRVAAEPFLEQLDDSNRLKLLLNLSNFSPFNADWLVGYGVKAAGFAQQALRLAQRLARVNDVQTARLNLANICLENKKYDSSERMLSSIVADSNSERVEILRYAYLAYAKLNVFRADYDKGLFYALKALSTVEPLADSSAGGDCFYMVSEVYYYADNYILSLAFAKRAIAAYTQISGEASLVDAMSYAVSSFTKKKRFAEGNAFLNQWEARLPELNQYDKQDMLSIRGYLLKGQKKFAEAEKYYRQVLTLAEENNQISESVYRNMGDVLVQDEKFVQAKPYLLKSLTINGGPESMRLKSLVHYYLYVCDSAAGEYLSAIRELNIADMYTNQIKDISKADQLEKLQVQYETSQKEIQIKLKDQNIVLLRSANQVQQQALARSELVKKITLAGIGILLLLLVFGFGYYQQRQKITRLISQKNHTISHKNAQLEQLLADKDWLLKEVHHRVKNNLHTIICLLESQAAYLQNDALAAVESSQHRIYAMSLVHQKLYQSEDVKTIDMSVYLPEFILYLRESFGSPGNIAFHSKIDPLQLDVSQAIPLALILNELVTNAMKYAFPKGANGIIKVNLLQEGESVLLNVDDNGIGIREIAATGEQTSLGLQLIRGLTQDLNGTVQFINGTGTSVFIRLMFLCSLICTAAARLFVYADKDL